MPLRVRSQVSIWQELRLLATSPRSAERPARHLLFLQEEGSLSVHSGSLPPQRPHETLVLLFKRATDRPQWLTSTFHLAGGSVEVVDVIHQKLGERRLKLVGHVEQEGKNFGRLVFTVPAGWVVLDAQVNGRRRSVNVRDAQAGLVDMGFTLRDRGWVLVDFARI